MVYTDPWMISSLTEHPDEAWRFVKFMTSKEVLEDYLRISGFPPARRSVMEDYLFSLSEASGHHSAAEILQALGGAQMYGAETPEHVVVGFNHLMPIVEPAFPRFWSGAESVRNLLAEVQSAASGVLAEQRR